MNWRHRRAIPALLAAALIAAACGGSGDDEVTTAAEAAAEDAPEPTATSAPASEAAPTAVLASPAPEPTEPAGSEPASATAEWSLQRIGTGIKPALALDGSGSPAIAFLTEAIEGGLFYATAADDWAIETIADGYFYGPIDLAFDPGGTAHVVYHDHQAPSFRPDAGDLTLAARTTDGWILSASGDEGHDGWDSAIRFGPSGELWAAAIEPIDFGTLDGVEFYEYDGSTWTVSSIGSPPITYQFNVAMATGAGGEPVLSYFDDRAGELHVATRRGDEWNDEILPTGGGMFSSLVIGADGSRHISFYAPTSPNAGDVRYGIDDGTGWRIETIATLDQVSLGMTGARRITSLALDANGAPIVALTDESAVWIVDRDGDAWTTELVLGAGGRPLGQQVQLVIGDDAWHLTTYEVTSARPLEGEILYLTRPLPS